MRRAELLAGGKGSISAALAAICAEKAAELLRSPTGCDVIFEVACRAEVPKQGASLFIVLQFGTLPGRDSVWRHYVQILGAWVLYGLLPADFERLSSAQRF